MKLSVSSAFCEAKGCGHIYYNHVSLTHKLSRAVDVNGSGQCCHLLLQNGYCCKFTFPIEVSHPAKIFKVFFLFIFFCFFHLRHCQSVFFLLFFLETFTQRERECVSVCVCVNNFTKSRGWIDTMSWMGQFTAMGQFLGVRLILHGYQPAMM